MPTKPIFIFSLPRAGSTLLQRLLSQHSEISSAPEPWIALPLFYTLKQEGVRAIYGHEALSNAVNGFIDSFPNKREDYLSSAATFLNSMYSLGSESDSIYFLDKTPRYHLIVDELIEAFPDAKFVFLWRNPVAIAASILETWGKGKWNLYMFRVDLYSGMESLVTAFNKYSDRSIAIKYENLVASPESEISRLLLYLGLDNENRIVNEFGSSKKIGAPGRGDPTGQYKYDSISKASIDSWKKVMANQFRRRWAKSYLKWIGGDHLKTMGYDIKVLNSEMDKQPLKYEYLLADIIRNIFGSIYCKYSVEDVRSNKPWRKNIFFTKN